MLCLDMENSENNLILQTGSVSECCPNLL